MNYRRFQDAGQRVSCAPLVSLEEFLLPTPSPLTYSCRYSNVMLLMYFPSASSGVNRHLKTVRCWTGTDKASEYRPVIADLTLP
jgi:hypothetical protein